MGGENDLILRDKYRFYGAIANSRCNNVRELILVISGTPELYVLIWRAADEGFRVVYSKTGDIGGVSSDGGAAMAERRRYWGGGAVRVERRERGKARLRRERVGFRDERIIIR